MRMLTIIVVLGALGLATPSATAHAASTAETELRTRMHSEREALLEAIVESWRRGAAPDLGQVRRLVDVQTRLQAIEPATGRDATAQVLRDAALQEVDSPQQLVRALGLSYYRQRGVQPDTRSIFTGRTYQLRVRTGGR